MPKYWLHGCSLRSSLMSIFFTRIREVQEISERNARFIELEFAADDELVTEALRRTGLIKRQ